MDGDATIAVSVIVPVREDLATLTAFLESIQPALKGVSSELVFVVNRPDSDGLTAELESVGRVIHAPTPASPYSARNRGLELARGAHVAFLDASCLPAPDWLQAGLARLDAGADLVAGRVEFRYSALAPTAAELWDAVTNVQQERAVARGVAKTANLFVSSRALAALGPFREGVRSGEDVRWTGQAEAHGLAVSYCEDAVVYKQARPLKPLLRKALRVGAGQAGVLSHTGRLARIVGAWVVPPSPARIRRAWRADPQRRGIVLALRIAGVGWCVQAAQAIGLAWPARFRQAD